MYVVAVSVNDHDDYMYIFQSKEKQREIMKCYFMIESIQPVP